MNKQKLLESLKQIDLTEDQASLYIYLLENGDSTPLAISRDTKFNRNKAYRILDELRKLELVKDNQDSWGQKYAAQSPDALEVLLYKKEEKIKRQLVSLNSTIEELYALSSGENSGFDVKVYKGEEGLKQMLWNELHYKEILTLGAQSINIFVNKKFAEKHRQECVERKIKIYEIGNSSKIDQNYTDIDEFRQEVLFYKFIKKNVLTLENHWEVYGDTISFFNWEEGDLKGLEFRNKIFADMFKQIFWHYWEIAESREKN